MCSDAIGNGVDESFIPINLHPEILKLRAGIMSVDSKDSGGLGRVILDIVDDIIGSGIPTSPIELLPFAKNFIGLRRQKSRIMVVVKGLMNNLLDPTFEFEMNLGNIVDTCCSHRVNATAYDYGNFYRSFLSKLQAGAIRDYCAENGLITYLNKLLTNVREQYFKEKSRGTVL